MGSQYPHTKHTTTFTILEEATTGRDRWSYHPLHLHWMHRGKEGHTIFLLLECNVFSSTGWELLLLLGGIIHNFGAARTRHRSLAGGCYSLFD
jgi:hypothetical protein